MSVSSLRKVKNLDFCTRKIGFEAFLTASLQFSEQPIFFLEILRPNDGIP